jgi:hypothetical protein
MAQRIVAFTSHSIHIGTNILLRGTPKLIQVKLPRKSSPTRAPALLMRAVCGRHPATT